MSFGGPEYDDPNQQEPLEELFGAVFDAADKIASRIRPDEIDAKLRRTLQEAGHDQGRTPTEQSAPPYWVDEVPDDEPTARRLATSAAASQHDVSRAAHLGGQLAANLHDADRERLTRELSRILTKPGSVLLSINESVIVNTWLSMNESDAISAISAHVNSAPTEDLDRLDEALLTMACIHFDPDVRRRLVKFYAMFKIVELLRFETFRGFPD